jgi:gliding motility-associated-like protein
MEKMDQLSRIIRLLLLSWVLLATTLDARADCIVITISNTTDAGCGMDNGSVTFSVTINPFDCNMTSPCDGTTNSIKYQLNLSGSPIAPPANYSAPAVTVTNLAPGNYTLFIYHFGSNPITPCDVETADFEIKDNNLTLTPSDTMSSNCTSATGSFTVTVSGGTGPYTVTATGSNPSTTISMSAVASSTTFSGLWAQTYTVTATSGSCSGTITVEVPPIVAVNLQVTAAPVRCNGGSDGNIEITQPPATGYTYSIVPATGTFLYPNFSGLPANANYIVTATQTSSGCSASKTVSVTQPEPLVVQANATNISCVGKTDGMVTTNVTGGNSGVRTYAWAHSSAATTANLSSLAPGTYSVTVTDSEGCTATASATVSDDAGANFTVAYDPEIASGSSPNITPSTNAPGYRFNWNIVETVNANIQPTPNSTNTVNNNASISHTLSTSNMRSPGVVVYHLQIEKINDSSCKGRADTLSVLIRPDTAGDPFIPEIYTPNGDGQNDNWLVVMPDGVEKGEYTIFNRLGGKVYEGDTLTPWDGTGCPDGAYFYVLRYAQNDREVVKKGAITIIRTSR